MVRALRALTLAACPALALGLARTVQEYPTGETLELEPGQLAEFIATGVMPPLSAAQQSGDVAPDDPDKSDSVTRPPAEKRSIETVHAMASYLQRLKVAEHHAEAAQAFVLDKEEQLERDFAPSLVEIERMTRAATTAAAQAEVRTMKERLLRMHYTQVASMDRQASFWMDRIATQKQLHDDLNAGIQEQQRLRDVATPAAYEDAKREVAQVRATEEDRLHRWLRGFAVSLKEEEDKASADGTLEAVAALKIPVLPSKTLGGWIPALRSRANRTFAAALRNETAQATRSNEGTSGGWIPVLRNHTAQALGSFTPVRDLPLRNRTVG